MIQSVKWNAISQRISQFVDESYNRIAEQVHKALTYFFYNAFYGYNPDILPARRQEIIKQYDAKSLQVSGTEIDALYIPSSFPLKTGNVVVLCLNGPYQRAKPEKHWLPFLKNGADVVLWNPEPLVGTVKVSQDLLHVLRTLKQNNPEQTIAVKAECASCDPSIKAVSELDDPQVHLIIDRGFGNAKKLVHSLSIFGRFSMVQNIVGQHFDCHGIEKIEKVKGNTLFMIPKRDQVLDLGKTNLTRDLFDKAQNKEFVDLKGKDHFSPWDYEAYNGALKFLSSVGVVRKEFEEVDSISFPVADIGCVRRTILPKVIHSCF